MSQQVKIAVDAMGGEDAPEKIIEGIEISLKKNNENFFYLFGNAEKISKLINNKELIKKNSEIINAKDIISDNESPLNAAKKGKESSMWKSIDF